jgi:hypothetical protein
MEEENILTDYEIENIKINVYSQNVLNDFKRVIKPILTENLKQYIGTSPLNKDGSLKSKISKPLNELLKKELESFKIIPFLKGSFSRLNFYVSVSEFDISLKLKLNFATSYNKKGDYMNNVYKEDYLYLARIEHKPEVENKIMNPITDKIIGKVYPIEDLIIFDLEICKAQVLNAKLKRYEYEKAKDEISLYTLKDLVR